MSHVRWALALAAGGCGAPDAGSDAAWQAPDAFRGPYQLADGGLPIFPPARVQCPPDPGPTVDPGCGPCCEVFGCYTPAPGEPCVDAASAGPDESFEVLERLDIYPDTLCRLDGPFDPLAAGAGQGACCYVAGTMMCI